MSQTVQVVTFHGQSEETKTYHPVNTSNDPSFINQNQNELNTYIKTLIPQERVSIVTTPLRFKRQDNDQQDLSNPVPIPDTQGTINFSFRKIFKLGVKSDTENSGQLMNLRFYVDTGKQNNEWDLGTRIYVGVDTTFKPQTQGDITNTSEPFNGEISSQQDQLQYSPSNMLMVKSDQFYDKQTHPQQTDDTKFFGDQPYVYLQIGLTSEQLPGKSSQLGQFYVYDEV